MDDGEAYEGDDAEPGKTRQCMPSIEEYEGSLVRYGVRLSSPQNNRGCG